MKAFIKHTVLGGIFFLIPVVFLYIILEKAKTVLTGVIHPLAQKWEISTLIGKSTVFVLVILLLFLICLAGGLLLRLPYFRELNEVLEKKFLHFLPGYTSLKMKAGALKEDEQEKSKAILVKIDSAWHIGIIMEQLNGYSTIFKPEAPEHKAGEVLIIPTAEMVSIPISMKQAFSYIANFGEGASSVIARHN